MAREEKREEEGAQAKADEFTAEGAGKAFRRPALNKLCIAT